jgi:hypothetical protein
MAKLEDLKLGMRVKTSKRGRGLRGRGVIVKSQVTGYWHTATDVYVKRDDESFTWVPLEKIQPLS